MTDRHCKVVCKLFWNASNCSAFKASLQNCVMSPSFCYYCHLSTDNWAHGSIPVNTVMIWACQFHRGSVLSDYTEALWEQGPSLTGYAQTHSSQPRACLLLGAELILIVIGWLISEACCSLNYFLKIYISSICPSIYCIPASVKSAFHVFMHSVLTATPWSG